LNSLVVRWLVDVQGNIVVLDPVKIKVVRRCDCDGAGNGAVEGNGAGADETGWGGVQRAHMC
jgi:hypothetical protein